MTGEPLHVCSLLVIALFLFFSVLFRNDALYKLLFITTAFPFLLLCVGVIVIRVVICRQKYFLHFFQLLYNNERVK